MPRGTESRIMNVSRSQSLEVICFDIPSWVGLTVSEQFRVKVVEPVRFFKRFLRPHFLLTNMQWYSRVNIPGVSREVYWLLKLVPVNA